MDDNEHPDRCWLRSIKPDDAIGVLGNRARQVISIIKDLKEAHRLPHTIGLFGTWGSGKTATVAYVADALEEAGYTAVYFNAYKYASYMEVVPALIYRLMEALPIARKQAAKERLLEIVSTLGGKYATRLGSVVESKFGFDPVEFTKDVVKVANIPKENRQQILEDYYTRVDRAQDTLAKVFKQSKLDKPVVVLIDELDRCDPGEAFEAMKQLRILFNMRGLNIVFVLVANPYPIGLAIRHQFGLDESEDEYEAGRILEKFVDTYIDLMEPESLCKYVSTIWDRILPGRLPGSSFILGLEARVERKPEHRLEADTLKNGTALERMSTSNSLYSNLRTLEKSLTVCAHQRGFEPSLWTVWHVALLKQSDPVLRRDVAHVTNLLKQATKAATLQVLRVLRDRQQLNGDGSIKGRVWLDAHEAHSPYSIYHSSFWEHVNNQVRELWDTVGREHAQILAKIKSSIPTMNFVITMCMPSLGDLGKLRIDPNRLDSLEAALGDTYHEYFANYGWVLGEY